MIAFLIITLLPSHLKKMAKKILPFEIDYDFNLMALIAPVKAYRLAWMINRTLNITLRKSEDLILHAPKSKQISYFSIYHFALEMYKVNYYLISNKSDSNVLLIPELRQVDFFLKFSNNLTYQQPNQLIERLKKIQQIQTIFQVNPKELKSKQNLIVDEFEF